MLYNGYMTLFLRQHKVFAVLILAWGAFFGGSVQAQTAFQWTNGSGNSAWRNTNNWDHFFFVDYPDASNERAVFSDGNFTGDQVISQGSGTITLAKINFESTGKNVTINGPGTLTFHNTSAPGSQDIFFPSGSTGTLTINADIFSTVNRTRFLNWSSSGASLVVNGSIDNGGNEIILSTVGTTGGITVNGTITGSGGLGMQAQALNAAAANLTAATTYTGTTDMRTGTLRLSGDATLGDGTGLLTFESMAGAQSTLELSNLNTTTIANPFNIRGLGFGSAGAVHVSAGDAIFSGDGTIAQYTVLNHPKLVVDSGATLGFTGSVTLSDTTTFEVEGAVSTSGSGAFSGTGNVSKTGSGSLTYSGGANTYSGTTTITAGSFVMNVTGGDSVVGSELIVNGGASATLSQSNQIGASTNLRLTGGTFNTGGFDEVLGTLILQDSSNFDLGAGDSVIQFTDSSTESWTAGQTFLLLNWTGSLSGGGTDQVFFGNDSSGITGTQVGQITFRDPFGLDAGDYSAQILGTGEVVPVPEPSTYAIIFGLVAGAYILWMRKKRAKAA